MQRVLCVSLANDIRRAVESIAPGSFELQFVDYQSAYRSCVTKRPDKILVDAATDPRQAYQAVRTLSTLGEDRPITILAGILQHRREFGMHSKLKMRADGYVLLGSEPAAELERALRSTSRSPRPSSAMRPESSLVILLVLMAPFMEWIDRPFLARACLTAAGAAGAAFEVARWRTPNRRRAWFVGYYLVLFAVGVALTVKEYAR
jgi:hypothetical protein